MEIKDEEGKANVYLKPDQVSLAIGKGGHNIKLAGKLTGYEIDVYRDSDQDTEDVDLEEFTDEIDSWILDELKAIGCDTARSVLDLPVEDLIKRTVELGAVDGMSGKQENRVDSFSLEENNQTINELRELLTKEGVA